MKDALPQTIYLKDYKVSPFVIEKTDLVFDLANDYTRVIATLSILRNPLSDEQSADLVLHGSEGLDLQSVAVDGQPLLEGAYSRGSESLTISGLAIIILDVVWLLSDGSKIIHHIQSILN